MTLAPLALTNYRVSTVEQLQNNSLARQEKICLEAASKLGAQVHKSWVGSVSSKKGVNLDRKDLQEMLDECKRNPRIKYAIFDELDRFMRAMLELAYFIIEFQKVGVKVFFASQPHLKTDTAADTLMLMLEAYKAEGSNEERQRKSISGGSNALNDGRYPYPPSTGYRRGYERAIPEIVEGHGKPLGRILTRICAGTLSPQEGLTEYNPIRLKVGLAPIKMDKFRKIITDPFYAGIVAVDKQVKVRNEHGLHEPLITKEQHEELLRIMGGMPKNQKGPRKNGNPKYPLSNLVICDLCIDKQYGRFVGLDLHNGKSRVRVYEKYRCRSCKRYVSREEMHQSMADLIKVYKVDDDAKQYFLSAIDKIFKERNVEAVAQASQLSKKINHMKHSISQQVEAATDPANLSIKDEILSLIKRKKDELVELEEKHYNLLREAENDKKDFLTYALNFLDNITEKILDENISRENRLKCKQLVFPTGFYMDGEKKVYTKEISPIYSLIINKRDAEASQKSHMVRVMRL